MNFVSHVETVFAWYLSLARTPGWKEQAWHRVNELAKTDAMYAELPARLVAEMRREQPSSSSPSSTGKTSPQTPQPRSRKGPIRSSSRAGSK
jgi:hypothetical protein